jgi:hypothetical protein
MDDTSTYYTNIVASGDCKTKISKHTQINQVKTLTNTFTPTSASSVTGKFEQWHPENIDNKEEFNMIVKVGKIYYWCDKHKDPLSANQGMYVFHKPTEHDAWLACKTALNEQRRNRSKAKPTIPAPVPTPKPSVTLSDAKLSLAKSLQEALGMMQANVGQKRLKRNILRRFFYRSLLG